MILFQLTYRFNAVTHVSTSMSLVCCLLMAVTGYVVFTDKTQGNILNNFSPDDLIINIARFCFGANMSTTSESHFSSLGEGLIGKRREG